MNSISLPNLCLTAQTIRTGPVDPDVGGIAVGVSSMFNVFEKIVDFSNVCMNADMAINILLRELPSRNLPNVCYILR